ncbi:MAG: hypothetical protein AAGA06_01345 [Pseudomonadota bacterium]
MRTNLALTGAHTGMAPTDGRAQALSFVLALIASVLFVCAVIYLEVRMLGGTMSEGGLVESVQALLIALCSLTFFLGAHRHPDQRGYLILVAALFLCMFVRENDRVLDQIAHGFWSVPTLLIIAATVVAVAKDRATLLNPLYIHSQRGSFWVLAVGFVQLIVFSRLFGSGLLWDHSAMQAGSDVAKRIVQEGTELSSYALILTGAFMSFETRFGSAAAGPGE